MLIGKPPYWAGPAFRSVALALAAALSCLAWGCASSRPTVAPQPPQTYLRQAGATDGLLALEVCVRSLVPARGRGPTIWLAGVTHLGERRYYRELQEFLDVQSLVLFEGIGATNGEFRVSGDDAFSLQAELARALGLTFQLDEINYQRDHFRNSDLTLDELEAAFRSLPTSDATSGGAMGLGALVEAMEGRGLLGGLARLATTVLAASPRLQAATRVALIEVFSALPPDLKDAPALPSGMQPLLTVLVDERNKVVVRDVGQALRARPPPGSVALFYGAGHMADLEARVCETLGYRPGTERWFTAFSVNPRRMGMTEFELGVVRRLVREPLQAGQPATP